MIYFFFMNKHLLHPKSQLKNGEKKEFSIPRKKESKLILKTGTEPKKN